MFQLWALVKIPAVCNLERMHIVSRLCTMCVVFTTPCWLDGPQSFCALFRSLTEFVFKFVQGWHSVPVYGVSVNLELLARVWLAGAVRAFTMLWFWNIALIKKTVWWENSEVDLSVWPTLISAEAHWAGIHNLLRSGWWVRSRRMPDSTHAFLACAWACMGAQ